VVFIAASVELADCRDSAGLDDRRPRRGVDLQLEDLRAVVVADRIQVTARDRDIPQAEVGVRISSRWRTGPASTVPLGAASGNATSQAPPEAAFSASATTLPIVASRSRNSGAACTAATVTGDIADPR
jgi:hypothetical protein